MHQDVMIVKEALAGHTAKQIKKRLKETDINMKVKEIVARLAAYGFIYDEADTKWVQVIPYDPFTGEEIVKLKALASDDTAKAPAKNSATQTIEEAIDTFSSDNRKSKTFYIDQDLAKEVKEFTDEKGIKLANFVEVALIDALKKYR